MSEFKVAPKSSSRHQGYAGSGQTNRPVPLNKVALAQEKKRYKTGSEELDRVLGSGFVDGEVVLIGGDPGIGKSTLLIQTLSKMSGLPSLYVSGEESMDQIALRAHRLNLTIDHVNVVCDVELESILHSLESEKPRIAVIDSIQTIYSTNLDSAPGTVSQIRECAAQLTRFAKTTGTILVLIGHVTKDGNLAGPRVLEHIVDAVLYFEGDSQQSHRIIRAFKNRFGAVHEIGIFSMSEDGLVDISNPSALFLKPHKKPVNGAIVTAIAEGNRPILVEVQALVDISSTPNPRRLGVGFDQNRLAMLLAILTKLGNIPVNDLSIFLNITGGLRITETGCDLPTILAIVSSLQNKPNPDDLLCFGEVGLTGELRTVQKGMERLHEAAKLGFKRALIPSGNVPKNPVPGLQLFPVDSLEEALQTLKNWR